MRRNFKKWKYSIQARLLIYFAVLVALFLVSMAVCYFISMNSVYRLTADSVGNSLRQINIDTDRVLSDAQHMAEVTSEDSDIQKALRRPLPDTDKEIYKERINFNNSLYYTWRSSENINGIYVLGANGAIFRSYYSLHKEEYRDEPWFRTVMETGKPLWMEPHEGSSVANNLNLMTISIIVPIHDKASTDILGVTVVDVLVEDLKSIQDGEMVFGGNTFILNEDDRIIYANNDELSEEDIGTINASIAGQDSLHEGDALELDIGGRKYLGELIPLSDSNWKILGLISYKDMYAEAQVMRNTILVFIVFFGGASLFMAWFGAKNIAGPLGRVLDGMRKVEDGDFSVRIEEDRKDEIGDLIHGFNHMVYKVDDLMARERDTRQKLVQAEFNALQDQIKPHFLYNTLDSINWMARMNRTDKVSEMIDSLTGFLRIGLSRGKDFISLAEEIRHVESYISIQKIRYDRILDYKIDVSEDLMGYRVIKMILQPLVENAIYHGIKEKDEHGTITITGEETEDRLVLCVSDDGLGMKPERLAQIRAMMASGARYNDNAYGVINVQRRIQAYFGEEYGLDFRSEYTKGTQVYITLPKKEEAAQNA